MITIEYEVAPYSNISKYFGLVSCLHYCNNSSIRLKINRWIQQTESGKRRRGAVSIAAGTTKGNRDVEQRSMIFHLCLRLGHLWFAQYATRVRMSEIFLSISRIDLSSSPAIICFFSFGRRKYVSHRSPSIVPFVGA